MWRSRWCQRLLGPPLMAAILTLAAGTGPAAASYQASVYENYTAFQVCMGWSSGMTDTLRTLATDAYARLSYSPSWYRRSAFTKSQVLSRTAADQAVYVQSHGDHYWYGGKRTQGFREDALHCTGAAIVWSPEVKARRSTGAHFVVMSTCYLGDPPKDGSIPMSQAYGIEQLRSDRDGTTTRGSEFFLGYRGEAWLDDQLKFERSFWYYLSRGYVVGHAFDLALTYSGKAARTSPTWFGTYLYTGVPWIASPCSNCA
jgi:hypothetical protein